MTDDLASPLYESLHWLPFPIAQALRTAQVEPDDPAACFSALLLASEALLQYLGTVVLLDAADVGDPLRFLGEGRGGQHASTGLWRQAIEQLSYANPAPTFPELPALLRSRVWGRAFLKSIGELVDCRNGVAHPSRTMTASDARARLPGLISALSTVLARVAWLADYPLVRITGHEPRTGEVTVRPLVGPEARRRPLRLPWADAPPQESVVILPTVPGGRWLNLTPLYIWEDEHLWAWGRAHSDAVEHYATDAPGEISRKATTVGKRWLQVAVRERAHANGAARFDTAQFARLRDLSVTRIHRLSGPLDSVAPGPADPLIAPVPATGPHPVVSAGAASGADGSGDGDASEGPMLAAAAPAHVTSVLDPAGSGSAGVDDWELSGSGLGAPGAPFRFADPEPGQGDPGALTLSAPGRHGPFVITELVAPGPEPHEEAPAAHAGRLRPLALVAIGGLAVAVALLLARVLDPPTANLGEPAATIEALTTMYNAREIDEMRGLFLPTLDCYYGRLADSKVSGPTVNDRFKHITGRYKRIPDAVRTVARREGDEGPEALVCEKVVFDKGQEGPPIAEGITYFGLRATPDGWRVFAEGGRMGNNTDSPCTKWLAKRFNVSNLSSLGVTQCGFTHGPGSIAAPIPPQ